MEIIHTLTPERANQIADYIRQQLLPLATPEKSKCALGRTQIWLQAEPNYATRKYMKAHTDDRLWQYIQQIHPNAACAQIYFGNRGIDWHRDGSYAAPTATIINLGRIALQTKEPNGTLLTLNLRGGEIIRFNAKWMHRAIDPAPDRIGIGIWEAAIDINDPANWQ